MKNLFCFFLIINLSLVSCRKEPDPVVPITNPEFIEIQGGTFEMGCTENTEYVFVCNNQQLPLHSVTVSDFKLSKYEITNFQYVQFLNEIGVESDGSYDGVFYIVEGPSSEVRYSENTNTFFVEYNKENHPVINVTFLGAKAYCEWAGGRLPTEAEWEYAARGGSLSQGYVYSGSNDIDEVAWYGENSEGGTQEVGSKNANELGLHDMNGNLREWCNDWYGSYNSNSVIDPQGPDSGTLRVNRGGSWFSASTFSLVYYRFFDEPDSWDADLGFRCAQDL